MSVPLPRRAWSAATKRWWRDFWESPQGQTLPPSVRPTVSRLFGWYHRRELLERRVDRLFLTPRGKQADKLFVEGSTGQPKVNPLVAELRSIEDQIEALERRIFGDLTVAASPGAGSDPAGLLEAANRRFVELASARESDESDDPRLQLLDGGRPGSSGVA